MKIVTWNCQGAFRKKSAPIAQFQPDIAVIQECEAPERLVFPAHVPQPTAMAWFGENVSKGLGVFSYTHLNFAVDESYDSAIRYCAPLCVSGTPMPLHLLAVWAMTHREPKLRYIGQVAQAIAKYQEFIDAHETLVVGDFNSNKQWDRKPRVGNHSWVVAALEQAGLVSAYHHWSGEAQGEETAKTLYMYRRCEQVYHIDYAFIPRRWLPRLQSLTVGEYEHWKALSDHMPIRLAFTHESETS